MKKTILIIITLVASVMSLEAKNYEINVGGVEVTSSNAGNVTGKDITITSGCSSGYVSYEESTNTLWLNNITIHRTGSGDYAIHNRKCDGLTIKFRGQCYLTSDKAAALKLQRNTTLSPQLNSYTKVYGNYSNNTYALDIEANNITITGDYGGELRFFAGNVDNGCVTRSGSGSLNFKGSADIRFYNDPPSSVSYTLAPAWRNVYANFYHGADVHVYGENYAIYDSYIHSQYDDVEVLIPYGGDYTHAEHVYFSSNYVAIINETNFPDANFRSYLMSSSGAGYTKGYLVSSDIESRTSFNYIYGKNISNLKGIEYFTNLTSMNCSNNTIGSTLDLSMLTKLTYLDCGKNRIYTLKVPSSLVTLLCNDNYISSLSLTSQTNLEQLQCQNNYLTSMDVSKCSKLFNIDCGNNLLTALPTLPNSLQSLDCSSNKFSGKLTVGGYSALTTLNVSNNTGLTYFECWGNALTSLNVQGCTALETLDCANNALTSLPSLPSNLKRLNCSSNRLTSLSSLPSGLITLACAANQINSLSVKGLNSLEVLTIYANQIKESAMGQLVDDLRTIPAGKTGDFLVHGGSGEGNEITPAQVLKARGKRWLPQQYKNDTWSEILVGDVNGDGTVNVSDVTTLVNMILNVIPKDKDLGDINGDGSVNVSDVTALVTLLLGVG